MEPKHIEGFVDPRSFADGGVHTMITYDAQGYDRPATLIVWPSGQRERVFTESEVKVMLRDMYAASMDGPFIANSQRMEECALRHNITL